MLNTSSKVDGNEGVSALQTAIGAMLENPLLASNQPINMAGASPRFSVALSSICRDMSSLCGELSRVHPSDAGYANGTSAHQAHDVSVNASSTRAPRNAASEQRSSDFATPRRPHAAAADRLALPESSPGDGDGGGGGGVWRGDSGWIRHGDAPVCASPLFSH
jgi:hypothetical protein